MDMNDRRDRYRHRKKFPDCIAAEIVEKKRKGGRPKKEFPNEDARVQHRRKLWRLQKTDRAKERLKNRKFAILGLGKDCRRHSTTSGKFKNACNDIEDKRITEGGILSPKPQGGKSVTV
jgi:hypothetical protein